MADIKVPYKTEGLYRVDDSELIKSIREGLCNTLCNADYHLKGGVVIRKYEDRVEYTNPGCLMMDVERMVRGGDSEPRNKTILKMFNFINIGERAGSGIPLIFGTSKKHNLRFPIIEESYNPDRATLTIYVKNAVANKETLNELEKQIMSYLSDGEPRSAKEISAYVGKNITTVKLSLYKLCDEGLVNASGTIKDKRYFR